MILLASVLKGLRGNWKLIAALAALVIVIALASYKIGYDKKAVEVANAVAAAAKTHAEETEKLNGIIGQLNARQPEVVVKTVIEYVERTGATDAEVNSDVTDLNSGALRLRVQIRDYEARAATAELAAATVGAYATRTAELSRETSEFLIREAGRADKIVHKVAALQKHLRDVYRYIEEYNQLRDAFYKEHGYAVTPPLKELSLQYAEMDGKNHYVF